MSYVELAASRGIRGFLHPVEAETLPKLAQGRVCIEIGAFEGYSAWLMAQTARSVFSVDTFQANDAGTIQLDTLTTLDKYLRTVEGLPNVSHFVGTSAEYAAIAKAEKKQYDLIFIDADHSYEAVRDDIALWYPRLKKGGIFAFHDCYEGHGYFPGVYQAVAERFGRLPNLEITLAWMVKK